MSIFVSLSTFALRQAGTAKLQQTVLGSSVAGTLDYGALEQMGRRKEPVGPYSNVYAWAKWCCYALFQMTQPLMKHWASLPRPLAELLEKWLDRLESLNIHMTTRIKGPGLTDLEKLPNLKWLALSNNGLTDDGLVNVNKPINLEDAVIDLSYTRISNRSLKYAAQFKELGMLNLNRSRMTGEGLRYIQGLNRLTELVPGGTQAGLKALEWLDLGDTRITAAGLVHLENLKNLRELRLSGLRVSAEGRKRLPKALPMCRIGQ
jgi:hypothetical protein